MNEFITMIRHYIADFEYFVIAVIFGVINALMRPPQHSMAAYVIEFVVSVTVATLIGFICVDMGLSDGLAFAATAISAILARDILVVVMGFGSFATHHKDSLYMSLWNKVTKKKQAANDDKKRG